MASAASQVYDLLEGTVPLAAPQASLQGANPRLKYEYDSTHNAVMYVDRQGYEGYALQFKEETQSIVELEAIDKWGTELASVLYTYRSIARALPTVSGDESQKKRMYSASFEVLDPAMDRVKQLIYFKERAITKWTTSLSHLIRAEVKQRSAGKDVVHEIPCEALHVQMLLTLDVLAVLDALKDTKAGLNNDFSTYKRAFQHVQADLGPLAEQKTTENNMLQPILASHGSLLSALRQEVCDPNPNPNPAPRGVRASCRDRDAAPAPVPEPALASRCVERLRRASRCQPPSRTPSPPR